LTTIASGPSNKKTLESGSPCIDTAATGAIWTDDAFHPYDTNFLTIPPTENYASQYSFNRWDMGPYVYVIRVGTFK
jgi:hypothetical protein